MFEPRCTYFIDIERECIQWKLTKIPSVYLLSQSNTLKIGTYTYIYTTPKRGDNKIS